MSTLDAPRIERMRSAVMYAVDEDVRRRGRRTRLVVRTGAALCALAVVAGVGAQLVGGHDNQAGTASSSAGSAAGSAGSAPAAVPAPRPAAGTSAGTSGQSSGTGRSIVTTGSAHLVTTTPLSTADDFSSWVSGDGGYVAGQTDTGTGSTARLTLTVRVPDEQSAITRLRALGTVDQVHTDAEDVTTQETDLDARIREARISIARLEAILSHTASVRDVLTAENALTSRQQQLESMVLQRSKLRNQVSLATLTVTFEGKPPAAVVAHRASWFHRAVTGSLHAFGVGVRAVITIIAFLLPWLVLAGLIALGWGAMVRLRQRRGQ